MKVKFRLHFRYGEVNWFNKDHWEKFTVDDVLRCLIDFTEVKEFDCNFNEKERYWEAKISIPPMTTSIFEEKFKEALSKFYGRQEHTEVNVLEMRLEKGEVAKFTTALMMSKIESKR